MQVEPSAAGASAEPRPEDAPGPRRPSSRGRVLVVEEDRRLLEHYADILLGQGYDISAARSSSLAERLLEAQGTLFDAVLTEATPRGQAVVRAAREAGSGVPVIVLSGGAAENGARALEEGALHSLVRPFAEDDLLRCVEHALCLRRLVPPSDELPSRPSQPRPALPESRPELEARLTRGLRSMYMTYQPIIRTRDGSVFGWEALLRTKEPAIDGPLAFLALAERLGRLRELSRTIRGSVARTAGKTHGVSFFVNLHHDDLLDEQLFDPASPLSLVSAEVVLEVTERRPIESLPDARERVARLRALGFRVAIDDLGAGYSGLTSLALLEPDFVKLDRGLVTGIDQQKSKSRLVASILGASHDLGQSVIAEGVETVAEHEALAGMGCDLMQGFFFREPEHLRHESRFPVALGG